MSELNKKTSKLIVKYIEILLFFIMLVIIVTIVQISNQEKYFGIISSLITALAILSSAALASLFAKENIKKGRNNIKLQETLKIITDIELDKEYLDAKTTWAKYRSEENHHKAFKKLFAKYYIWGSDIDSKYKISEECLNIKSDKNNSFEKISNDYQLVTTFFNHFELISLGIHKEIIDEGFYKSWYGSSVISTWNYSSEAVGALRVLRGNQLLYQNWEKLAKKWEKEFFKVEPAPPFSISDLVMLLDDDISCKLAEKSSD